MTKGKVVNVDFKDTPDSDKSYNVAVYGSLRKGLHNHRVLDEDSEYLGDMDSPPVYSMYAVSGSFPGLKEDGTTSIKMEVYQVTESNLESLNQLEGYHGEDYDHNFYNRTMIDTPYGPAYLYIYNGKIGSSVPLVESGDWKDFYETSRYVRD